MLRQLSQKPVRKMKAVEFDYTEFGLTMEEIMKSIEDAAADRLWFYDNLDEIRKKHVSSWVAVRNKKIVDSDKSHERLLKRLESAAGGLSDIDVMYVYPKNIVTVY